MAIAAIASIVLKKFDDLLKEEPNLFIGIEVKSIQKKLQAIGKHTAGKEDAEQIPTWLDGAKELVFETEDILDSFLSWKERRRKQNILVKHIFFIHFRNNFSNKLKRIHSKCYKSSRDGSSYGINPSEDRVDTNPPEDRVDTNPPEDRVDINPPEDRVDRREPDWVVREDEVIGLENDVKLLVARLIDEEEDRDEIPSFINWLEYGINPPEDKDETSSFINWRAETDRLIRKSYWFGREGEVVVMEKDKEFLVSQLINEDKNIQKQRRAISIVGMGGIGKTTLAKLVYNHSRITDHFKNRCWIYVSQDYSLIEISNHLKKWKAEMYISLRNERCLFVLDNVCDAKAYREIEDLLPDTGKGSRILLTTRSREVALMADANPRSHPHKMKLLSDDDSWLLLQRCMGYNEKPFPSDKWIEVGKEIAKKCRGLPLSIKTVGGLMYGKTLIEWNMLFKTLDEGPTVTSLRASPEIIGDDHYFSEIFKLSYTNLPSHLIPLYLYLFLFPKEHEMPLRRIFGLWLAGGFLTGECEDVSREGLAQVYLQDLISRGMIQVVKLKLDGKPKTCRVPSRLHDEFYSKACEMGLFPNQKNSLAPPTSGVRHLVEYKHYYNFNNFSNSKNFKNYFSLEDSIQNPRSYISFNIQKGDVPAEVTGRLLDKVIQRRMFRLLGVLDLELVYKPKLPDSLGKLNLLKYLGLRWTFLDAIPSSVGDLLNLETLDVKHTYISRLPSSIHKMKKLQHLYLNEIHLDLSVGDIALQNLQTLWGLTADGENPTKNNLNCLITLTKLGLTVQDTLVEKYAKWISSLTALRILRFRSRDVYGQPSHLKLGSFSSLSRLHDLHLLGRLTVENPLLELQLPESLLLGRLTVENPLLELQLPESLTVLTLSVSQLKQDPMPTLENLPNLRALRLFANSFTGKRMVCSNGRFRSLRILKLWMLEELEEWIIEEGAMSSLTQLEIRCCNKLKKCPNNMPQLPSLKDLILTNMSKDFIAGVEARKRENVSLTLNNWEFPTFPSQDQESSHGSEGSG